MHASGIPMAPGVDSLNVATAAAVTLAHLTGDARIMPRARRFAARTVRIDYSDHLREVVICPSTRGDSEPCVLPRSRGSRRGAARAPETFSHGPARPAFARRSRQVNRTGRSLDASSAPRQRARRAAISAESAPESALSGSGEHADTRTMTALRATDARRRPLDHRLRAAT